MSYRQPRATSTPASRQPRSASVRVNCSNTNTNISRSNGARPASASAARTHVADVNPTYTIKGTVLSAETINDRIAWTAEASGELAIRSLPKGTVLKTLDGRPRTRCAALLYVESQQQLWSAFEDGYVRIYSVLHSALEHEFSASETVGAAVTSLLAVEGMIFAGCEDGAIVQWEADTLHRSRVLPGHLSPVRCLACYMGPSGSVIFSGGDDSLIKAWDPYVNDTEQDGGAATACMYTFIGHMNGAVRAVEIVNYANQMWSAGDDATVRIWNLETLACVATLSGHHHAPVTSLLSIESRMWSGDKTGHIMLWDINSSTPLQDLGARAEGGAAGQGGVLAMKKMQPSTSWKVWTAGAGGVVQCWNAETVPILFSKLNGGSRRGSSLEGAGKNGRGNSLHTQCRNSGARDEDSDEDVKVWRQFQQLVMTANPKGNGGGGAAANPNADGRQPGLGIVDIQRLANEMGYERGRMEVQRELQTQQLLEEENAQLKVNLRAFQQRQQSPQPTKTAASGAAAGAAPSPALPQNGSVRPSDIRTSRLTRRFTGGDWAYVMTEKPHELHETFKDEASTALGVPGSQISDIHFACGSLVADIEVVHHSAVSTAEMDDRLQAYAFPQLTALHDTARKTAKKGLDAAEETLVALEQQLQAALSGNHNEDGDDEEEEEEDAWSRPSPEPRLPSHVRKDAAVAAAAAAEERLAAANEELAQLREENEALQRLLERDQAPSGRGASNDPELERLLAVKDAENHRLQDQLDALREEQQRLQQRLASGTPVGQALEQCAHSHSHHDNSRSPPAIDRTSYKDTRPDSLAADWEDGQVDAEGFRSPMDEAVAPVPRAVEEELRKLKDENAALNAYQQDSLKPSISKLERGNAEKDAELRRLRREKADLQAKLAKNSNKSSGKGDGAAQQALQAQYDALKDEYEALDNYLHNTLKPSISRLKRLNGEKDLLLRRLQQPANSNSISAGRQVSAQRPQTPEVAGTPRISVDKAELESSASTAIDNSGNSAGEAGLSGMRRDLLRAQSDAAAKGTALRQVQRELDALKRSIDASHQADVSKSSSRGASLENPALAARQPSTASATIDHAMERELRAKDAELEQLRGDVAALEEKVCQHEAEVASLQNALQDAGGHQRESRVRAEKTGEAVQALQAELARERAARAALAQQLANTSSNHHSDTTSKDENSRNHSVGKEKSIAGRGTEPAVIGSRNAPAGGGSHSNDEGNNSLNTSEEAGETKPSGVEAKNLALALRLADAEAVITDLQVTLERTSSQLDQQRRETDRLMNIIADLQEGNSR